MDLVIDALTEKDVPRLARVMRRVADEEVHVALPPGMRQETAESLLTAALARAEVGVSVELVARVKGKIVGGASLEPGGPRQEHLGDAYLYLDADWRGKGIGGRMLNALEAAARERALVKVTAVVFAGNLNARQLFESRGYEEEGLRHRQWNLGVFHEDEVLLAKFLGT